MCSSVFEISQNFTLYHLYFFTYQLVGISKCTEVLKKKAYSQFTNQDSEFP